MKSIQILFATLTIHQVHAVSNLRHGGGSEKVPLASMNSDRFAQGSYSSNKNHGSLQPVRQNQYDDKLQDIFYAATAANNNNDNDRNLQQQQCDFCGSQGSCGRTTPLVGDFYSVTVEDTELDSSWLVSCLHSNRNAPDCYYSPDGEENIISIPPEADFEETIFACPNECCTWAYPRSKWANLPVSDTVACDGETNCREISQICHLRGKATKTFSCPIGTMMYLEGGRGSTTLRVGSGAQIVSASTICKQVSNGIQCPYNRLAFSMAALVAADDCNCITCDNLGIVREGTCSTPIPSNLPSEGQCPTTATTGPCFERTASTTNDTSLTNDSNSTNDTGLTFSLTAGDNSTNTTDDDNDPWTLDRNEDDSTNDTGLTFSLTAGDNSTNTTDDDNDPWTLDRNEDDSTNDTGLTFSLTAGDNSTNTDDDNDPWTLGRNEDDDINGTASAIVPIIPDGNSTEIDTEFVDDNTTGIFNETFADTLDEATDSNATFADTLVEATDSNSSTVTLSDLAQTERNEMLLQANSTKAAMEALEKSITEGTLTKAEKLKLLQTMEDSLVALKTAIETAIEYQPLSPSYCLGIIAAIQSQLPMLRCGITNECISGADMLQVLMVYKALVVEIISSQLLLVE